MVSFKNVDNVENSKPSGSKEKEWEDERERLLGQVGLIYSPD